MYECAYCLFKAEYKFESLEFPRYIEMCRVNTKDKWVLFRQNEHTNFCDIQFLF
jgi:hypothetical protein